MRLRRYSVECVRRRLRCGFEERPDEPSSPKLMPRSEAGRTDGLSLSMDSSVAPLLAGSDTARPLPNAGVEPSELMAEDGATASLTSTSACATVEVEKWAECTEPLSMSSKAGEERGAGSAGGRRKSLTIVSRGSQLFWDKKTDTKNPYSVCLRASAIRPRQLRVRLPTLREPSAPSHPALTSTPHHMQVASWLGPNINRPLPPRKICGCPGVAG